MQTRDITGLGFALSVIGVSTGGVLSMAGIVISLVALRRRSDGFAVWGLIIGFGGILLWLFIGAVLFALTSLDVARARAMEAPYNEARFRIEEFVNRHGALPDDAAGQRIVGTIDGHPLRYKAVSDDIFRIEDPGYDGVLGTKDDRTREWSLKR